MKLRNLLKLLITAEYIIDVISLPEGKTNYCNKVDNGSYEGIAFKKIANGKITIKCKNGYKHENGSYDCWDKDLDIKLNWACKSY